MRSLIKRSADGIRCLDSILLILALLFLLAVGGPGTALALMHEIPATRGVFACVALLAATVLLWLTVDRWSRWLTGLALIAALKILPAIISGTYWTGSRAHERAPRILFAGLAASFVILALLSVRFVNRRPKTDEKVVLVLFVLLCDVALPIARLHVVAWTAGLVALLLIWLKGLLPPIRASGLRGWWRLRWSTQRQ